MGKEDACRIQSLFDWQDRRDRKKGTQLWAGGDATGTRTPIVSVKGWCPDLLDDGAIWIKELHWKVFLSFSLSYVYIIPHFSKKVNKINGKILFLWKISHNLREIHIIFLKIFYLFTKTEQYARFFVNFCEFLRFYCGRTIRGLGKSSTPDMGRVSDSAMLHLAEGAGLEPTMTQSKCVVIPI